MEIIDMIKKSTKMLKQTNYGKKIYDNLLSKYGEYLHSNANTNGNTQQAKSNKNLKKNNNQIKKIPTAAPNSNTEK
jgi:hypothetical protein